MKIAVIDLGTNTFNLLIVERSSNGEYKKIESTRIPVKLGEGTINQGYISDLPFKRGISALKKYSELISEHKVETVRAIATSAIRSARNGADFVSQAKEETGIDIEIIDGEREAELIYFGNRAAVNMNHEYSLIMDIGGGSTEFIIGNSKEILWKKSFLLGAARLLEYVNPSDPIKEHEKKKLISHLEKELEPLHQAIRKYPVIELIGSSGAFDSIVDMMAEAYKGESVMDHCTEYCIDLNNYFPLSSKVINASYADRMKIKGLIEMRVDMISISCLFVNYILSKYNLNKFRVSTYSLKEGVIFST